MENSERIRRASNILLALNWESMDVPITKDEITRHVKSPSWQKLRQELKGTSLEEKHKELRRWLKSHNSSRASTVQVANYVKALRRGGLI